MKVWCIINLADLLECWTPWKETGRLDKEWAPTVFYFKKEFAEQELLRLQQKYPEGEFYIFEGIEYVVSSITVKGLKTIEATEIV